MSLGVTAVVVGSAAWPFASAHARAASGTLSTHRGFPPPLYGLIRSAVPWKARIGTGRDGRRPGARSPPTAPTIDTDSACVSANRHDIRAPPDIPVIATRPGGGEQRTRSSSTTAARNGRSPSRSHS